MNTEPAAPPDGEGGGPLVGMLVMALVTGLSLGVWKALQFFEPQLVAGLVAFVTMWRS